jgi:hypothetical protein
VDELRQVGHQLVNTQTELKGEPAVDVLFRAGVLAVDRSAQPSFTHEVPEDGLARMECDAEEPRRLLDAQAQARHLRVRPEYARD